MDRLIKDEERIPRSADAAKSNSRRRSSNKVHPTKDVARGGGRPALLPLVRLKTDEKEENMRKKSEKCFQITSIDNPLAICKTPCSQILGSWPPPQIFSSYALGYTFIVNTHFLKHLVSNTFRKALMKFIKEEIMEYDFITVKT